MGDAAAAVQPARAVDLRQAEDELVGYFTGAIGVRAQNYDAFGTGDGGSFDPDGAFVDRLPSQRAAIAHCDRVTATLAQLDGWNRWILRRLYEPRRWCADLLASALNGAGVPYNLSGVASLTERAQRLAERQHATGGAPADTDREILSLLETEAVRLLKKADEDARTGKKGAHTGLTIIEIVRAQSETMRTDALTSYEVFRRIRVGGAKKAKKARGDDAAYARILAGLGK